MCYIFDRLVLNRVNVKIIITQWALDSYLKLKHGNVFPSSFYNNQLKPDALLLKKYKNHPQPPEFSNNKFWSIASINGAHITDGYKMKWHQVGNGCVQLRLPVTILSNEAFLCTGYVKNAKAERRYLCSFKTHCQLIKAGKYTQCGELQ